MDYIKKYRRCIYLQDDTWKTLTALKRTYKVNGCGAVIDILAKIAPQVKPTIVYTYQVVQEEQQANG